MPHWYLFCCFPENHNYAHLNSDKSCSPLDRPGFHSVRGCNRRSYYMLFAFPASIWSFLDTCVVEFPLSRECLTRGAFAAWTRSPVLVSCHSAGLSRAQSRSRPPSPVDDDPYRRRCSANTDFALGSLLQTDNAVDDTNLGHKRKEIAVRLSRVSEMGEHRDECVFPSLLPVVGFPPASEHTTDV